MGITIDGAGTITGLDADGISAQPVFPGQVLQVVSTTKTDAATIVGEGEIPGLSVSITPKNDDNKLLILYSLSFSATDGGVSARRGGTTLLRDGQNVGNAHSAGYFNISTADEMENISFQFFDTASSTDEITYSIAHTVNAAAMVLYVNRTRNSGTAIGVSNITVMEIAV